MWPFATLLARGLDVTAIGDTLGSERTWRVVWFTLLQATLSTLLSLALAIPVARALARRQFPGRGLLLRVFALSLVIPTVVAIFGIVAVHGRTGWLNDALAFLVQTWAQQRTSATRTQNFKRWRI